MYSSSRLLSPLPPSTLSICHNQTLLPAFALQHEVFLVVSIRTLLWKFTVHCFVLNPKGHHLAGSGDQKYGVCQLLHATSSTCSLSSRAVIPEKKGKTLHGHFFCLVSFLFEKVYPFRKETHPKWPTLSPRRIPD